MWAFRAIPGAGVYWSLTICRTRRDGERDRRYAVVPCGLWTPAGAHRALNSPQWRAAQGGVMPGGCEAPERGDVVGEGDA